MMVSLPAKWVKKLNIQKGEELEILETDLGLLLSPTSTPESQTLKIDVNATGFDIFLQRFLFVLYQNGYDEIRIKYDNPEFLRKIVTEQFVGLEIVNYKKDFIELKSVSKGTKEEFDSMLRRTFLINKQMIPLLGEMLFNKDTGAANLILEMEKTNNRFTNYCRRILIKGRSMQDNRTPFLYSFVSELEKISDNVKYLVNRVSKLDIKKIKINSELKPIIKTIEELSHSLMNQFYDFKLDKMLKEYRKTRNLINKIQSIQNQADKNNLLISMYLIIIVQNLSNLYGYLLYLRVNELEHLIA